MNILTGCLLYLYQNSQLKTKPLHSYALMVRVLNIHKKYSDINHKRNEKQFESFGGIKPLINNF